MLEGRPIVIYGNGRQNRDSTRVDDIVAGIVVADNAPAGTVANPGGGQCPSLRAALDSLEGVAGNQLHIDVRPGEPNDLRDTWACVSVATASFGWSPYVRVANGPSGIAQMFCNDSEPVSTVYPRCRYPEVDEVTTGTGDRLCKARHTRDVA